MKKLLLGLLVSLMFAVPGSALAVTKRVHSHVASNADLVASPVAAGVAIIRDGYFTAGDTAPLIYHASTSACTLNAGAGDNGSQVAASGGCWIAVLQGIQPSPKMWGCVGDGVTNDAVCLQAAITATGTGKLYSGPYLYKSNTALTSAAQGFEFVCDTKRGPGETSPYGLRAGVANIALLTLTGNGQAVRNCYIDNTNNGAIGATTGRGIVSSGANAFIEENAIIGGCNSLDVSGNVVTVRGNRLTGVNVNNAGCAQIRVGHTTTFGATVDVRIDKNVAECGACGTPYEAGLLVEDAGGILITSSDFLFAKHGTKVYPGVNQEVDWLTATGTYLSDTSTDDGVLFDTAAASGVIKGASIVQGWSASSVGGSGIRILNSAAGTVKGIYISDSRIYANGKYAVLIEGGSDIVLNGNHACGNSVLSAGTYGSYTIGAGITGVTLLNNRGGPDCASFATVTAFGVFLGGTNGPVMIVGNDFTGNAAPIVYGAGAFTGKSIVHDNRGIDDTVGTIATASSISPFPNQITVLTGTTTITTITVNWENETHTFVTQDGAVLFNTGGNICNAVTSAGAKARVEAVYIAGFACWSLK